MRNVVLRNSLIRQVGWGVICVFLLFGGRTAWSATIKGIVNNGTAGIGGLVVATYEENSGSLTGWDRTDSQGKYEIPTLSAAISHKVVFFTYYTDYIEEWYTTTPHAYTFFDAELITLASESAVKDLGVFTLRLGANIAGIVTEEGSGNFIENISVVIYDSDGNVVTNAVPTTTNGAYDIGGLNVGTYFVQFWAGNTDYTSEWYSESTDAYTRLTSTSIEISSLSETLEANVQLVAGGAISGTVTSSGAPVVEGLVEAYDAGSSADDSPVGFAETDTNGMYTIKGLPTTESFKVRFYQTAAGGGLTEWYDNKPDINSAVPVTTGTSDVDAMLGDVLDPPNSSFNWLLFLPTIIINTTKL
ncbi:Por secretion system C-terminal sorting domain-containing protein [Candidatus Electrothrix aarhusensis]|uniref:Por secretion system C-terminal sorting domain-containing protein n=1 Tax=Candidatus Electrothrix aarhusensis TaxID=1859131 RepID=A0A444J345_9BACT|nr:Por secretion system C-terminal sorting domain-containing protein [Candidatus Electrothrix aarhusensis]